MEILGLTFVGTRTVEREATARFARDVLGLAEVEGHGMDAEVFALPDGSSFAVTSPERPSDVRRTVGFRVADLDAALVELTAAGVETDEEISASATQRYLHFTGPDGRLYELVEELDPAAR